MFQTDGLYFFFCIPKLPGEIAWNIRGSGDFLCVWGFGSNFGAFDVRPKISGGGTPTDFSRWCFQFFFTRSPLPGGSGPIWLIYLIFIKWVGFLPSTVGNLIVFLWCCFIFYKFYLLLRHLPSGPSKKNRTEATMNQWDVDYSPLPWRGPTRSEKNPSSWIRTSWWFPARKPVEVGSLSHSSQGF